MSMRYSATIPEIKLGEALAIIANAPEYMRGILIDLMIEDEDIAGTLHEQFRVKYSLGELHYLSKKTERSIRAVAEMDKLPGKSEEYARILQEVKETPDGIEKVDGHAIANDMAAAIQHYNQELRNIGLKSFTAGEMRAVGAHFEELAYSIPHTAAITYYESRIAHCKQAREEIDAIGKPGAINVNTYLNMHMEWLGRKTFYDLNLMPVSVRIDAFRDIVTERQVEYEAELKKAVHARDNMLDAVRIPPPNTGNKMLDGMVSSMVRKGLPMVVEYYMGVGIKRLGPVISKAMDITGTIVENENERITNQHDKGQSPEEAKWNAAVDTASKAVLKAMPDVVKRTDAE